MSDDRIIKILGGLKDLLIDTFRHYNPITEEYLGGDRYVKE